MPWHGAIHVGVVRIVDAELVHAEPQLSRLGSPFVHTLDHQIICWHQVAPCKFSFDRFTLIDMCWAPTHNIHRASIN